MKLDLTGIRIEVTDAIRSFTEKKIKKLDKFFDDELRSSLTIYLLTIVVSLNNC